MTAESSPSEYEKTVQVRENEWMELLESLCKGKPDSPCPEDERK